MPTHAPCSPTPGSTCARTRASARATSPSSWTRCWPAGVDIVQLRDKGMEAGEELEHLEVFADACRRHGKLLAVNDRADVAHAAAPTCCTSARATCRSRPPAPSSATTSSSAAPPTPSRGGAAAAAEPGVDYFCTGPCWPTPTKPGRHAPGLDLVRLRRRPGHRPALVRASAASTPATSTRCWTRARAGSSSSGRSPRPTTRGGRRGVPAAADRPELSAAIHRAAAPRAPAPRPAPAGQRRPGRGEAFRVRRGATSRPRPGRPGPRGPPR